MNISPSLRDQQAQWPKRLLEGGLDLKRTFYDLEHKHLGNLATSLRAWYRGDPSILNVGLTDDELSNVVPEEFVRAFSTQEGISEAQTREAVRQLILRAYNLVSQNGELPSTNEVATVERLIRNDRLGSVFPVTEELGKLLPP